MEFIRICLVLLLSVGIAHAETTPFICKGANYVVIGENIYAPRKDSGEKIFDLLVDSKLPSIYGYPNNLAIPCMQNAREVCAITPINLSCECQSDIGKATLSISRNSGKLSILQSFAKSEAVWQGDYLCSKVIKKLF